MEFYSSFGPVMLSLCVVLNGLNGALLDKREKLLSQTITFLRQFSKRSKLSKISCSVSPNAANGARAFDYFF
jgi:hypothetical protein